MTMTIPVAELSDRAADVRFSRVIATSIAFVFVSAGFLAGGVWRALVFAALSVQYGFRQGAGIKVAADPPRLPPA